MFLRAPNDGENYVLFMDRRSDGVNRDVVGLDKKNTIDYFVDLDFDGGDFY